jgi:hypothetical protein
MPRAKPHRNSHWKLLNIKGTSDNKCVCNSWLDHWYNYTDSSRETCAVVPCSNPAQVGAHVQVDDWRSDFSWWIAPLCHKHNRDRENKREMYLDKRSTLVSANAAETCQRGDWRWKVK